MKYKKLSFWSGVVVLATLLAVQTMHAEEEGALEDITSLSSPEEGTAPQDGMKELERALDESGPTEATSETSTEAPSATVVEKTTKSTVNADTQLLLETADSSSAPSGSGLNEITNLEFKMEGGNSRILISSRQKLAYKENRSPGMRQLVYLFENTRTSQRLERAYDTTEFVSPVALFTLLQIPKTQPPVTKLIVQLREEKFPSVSNSERGLVLDFPAPDLKQEPKLLTTDDEKGLHEENIYSGNLTYSGKNIKRLEIKNSDVQDVLRLIAKSSGYNVVIGDDVTGKVGTLSLENIPWDQAFTLVLQMKKLGYIRQGNVLRVGTLSSLKSEKEEALATESSKIRVEPLRTLIVPISYAKAVDMAARAKNFLSERGSVEPDTRSNSVILKDIEKNVIRIQKLFSVLDSQPPKVSIAAKFVEVSETFSRDIGFQSHRFNMNFGGISLDPVLSYPKNGSSLVTVRAPNFAGLESLLSLGQTDSKVKVLANPTLTISSNQKGTVTQGTTFSFQSVENIQGILTNVFRQVTANLILEVTPIVSGDGSISMDIRLQNEIPKKNEKGIDVDLRKVETSVLVENGDTVVIGGVYKDSDTSIRSGDPFLMSIPILGYLFSNSSRTTERIELLVFITPKVLNVDEAFKRSF